MKQRCAFLACALLVVFGGTMTITQLRYGSKTLGMASIIGSFQKGEALARIADISERDAVLAPSAGSSRHLDLILPDNARLFMSGMTGAANADTLGNYFYLTYFVFPREIAITLDTPRYTPAGFEGRSSSSDAEMLANGFDVRVDLSSNAQISVAGLRNIPVKPLANPPWFGSPIDAITACLLPLFTALSGMWLLRLLFSPFVQRQSLMEQLACGLGLGMMAVAAFTLGVKLCGAHGRSWVFIIVAMGALGELWHDRKRFVNGVAAGFRKTKTVPLATFIFAISLVVFLILFRLAALQGMVEFDAVAAWMLKAKILFLSTGHELIGWFSNPRLAYAHLDYPTLVPSLHTATFDSIGHVDEFVTKFWPAWMLLFLLAGLASMSRGVSTRFHAPLFFLLGVLLLPFIQEYVQMEGATLPMVFFTVLGIVQCGIALAEKSRARLGLGFTLLFGAAMCKFEGMIFLVLAAGCILLPFPARPPLKWSFRMWRVLAFCLLAALPFICLRAQIPVLHYESGWAGYAAAHPVTTISSAAKIFPMLLAREFLDTGFAKWNVVDGQIHWAGQWNGISSLFNHLTFGLAWVCLLMTVLLWLAAPDRRPIILWTIVLFLGALAVLAVVYGSFVSITGLNDVVENRIAEKTFARYPFPMLLACGAAIVTLFFRYPSIPKDSFQ